MQKAIVAIIAAAGVLLVGYFLVTRGLNQEASNPMTPGAEANPVTAPITKPEVTYTDSGFEPKPLTIKVGSSVTFVNQSSSDMWVASNPHPTHTDLSDFDAKQGIPNGGRYTYTFTKAGSWGFHNHLKSSDMGKVVVVE